MSRLYRAALLAYPRSFRRAYGPELIGAARDLRRHGGVSRTRLALRLAFDIVCTAPRMRVEAAVRNARVAGVVSLATIAIVAVAVGSSVLLVLIGSVVGLLALLGRRHDRPIVTNPEETARWYRWLMAAAVAFAVGFLALLTSDGDELSSTAWTIWMLAWGSALVLALFALVLGTSHAIHRRRAGL